MTMRARGMPRAPFHLQKIGEAEERAPPIGHVLRPPFECSPPVWPVSLARSGSWAGPHLYRASKDALGVD